MKAVYITEFGDLESLELHEIPNPPAPEGSQVLVRVRAAGLNRADLLQVRGAYPPPPGYSANIPGLEFAGEVVATGPDSGHWKTGDRVFAITAGEAQAEHLITDATLLTRIPENLGFTEAAAIPEAFITAHDAIITQGRLSRGETILIHAVGSGVGLAALQIAKSKGARTIGTSRTVEKLERCRDLGLGEAIATDENSDFAGRVLEITDGKGADVILELVGAPYFQDDLKSAAKKGRIVLVGLTGGSMTEFDMRVALSKRLTIIGTVLRARSTEEKSAAIKAFSDDLLPLFASGVIRPNLDRVFPASEVVSAYKYLQSNESFGKVVLEF